ncbi:MAG TPA: hypothetical protein VIZ87_06335 [Terrimicrobium sp.]
MSLFDPLQKFRIFFLLHTITLFCVMPKPAKIISNLREQLNHVGFVL